MKMILAAAVLVALGTAAAAQTSGAMAPAPMRSSTGSPMAAGAMAADPMAHVPASAKPKITRCLAMAHDAMMANATCATMMKSYPAAFAGTAGSN